MTSYKIKNFSKFNTGVYIIISYYLRYNLYLLNILLMLYSYFKNKIIPEYTKIT